MIAQNGRDGGCRSQPQVTTRSSNDCFGSSMHSQWYPMFSSWTTMHWPSLNPLPQIGQACFAHPSCHVLAWTDSSFRDNTHAWHPILAYFPGCALIGSVKRVQRAPLACPSCGGMLLRPLELVCRSVLLPLLHTRRFSLRHHDIIGQSHCQRDCSLLIAPGGSGTGGKRPQAAAVCLNPSPLPGKTTSQLTSAFGRITTQNELRE